MTGHSTRPVFERYNIVSGCYLKAAKLDVVISEQGDQNSDHSQPGPLL